MFFSISTFFLFSFLFFKTKLVLSIPYQKLRKVAITQQTFQRFFNVVLGRYAVVTSHNVKSTLKQRFHVIIGVYNVEQRRINVVHFNVDLNIVGQRRNNVVIFNVDFNNVGQP